MDNKIKSYEKAEIEILLFACDDIITTSDSDDAFDGEDDSW